MKKKLFSLLMTLTLVLSYMSAMVYADEMDTNTVMPTDESLQTDSNEEMPESDEQAESEQLTNENNVDSQAETEDSKAVNASAVQSESNDFEVYTNEGQNAILDSAESYSVGDMLHSTIPANTSVAYKVDGAGEETAVNLYVQNANDNEQDIITYSVINEDGLSIEPITAEDAYYETAVSGGESYGFDLPGGCWSSLLYTLTDGDTIVFTAGDKSIDINLFVQEVVGTTSYWYGGDYEEFGYGYLSEDAQLIYIHIAEECIRDVVLYVENRTSEYDFNYCLLSSDGQIVRGSDGCDWGELPADYSSSTPYTLDEEDYYLLIFNKPGQIISDEYDSYYTSDEVDVDIADFSLCITPRNIKYYNITGIKNKTYTGKAITQNVDAEYDDIILASGDYKVLYSNNKNVGTATVTITGQDPYTGTLKKTFKINPKGTSISKLSRAKKGFTVKWKKQTAKMSGSRINSYQVQYSTKKSFSGAKIKTINGYSKTSKKITGLKKKTTYYVRVRTCKKVSGKWYYSSWSAAKIVKTK